MKQLLFLKDSPNLKKTRLSKFSIAECTINSVFTRTRPSLRCNKKYTNNQKITIMYKYVQNITMYQTKFTISLECTVFNMQKSEIRWLITRKKPVLFTTVTPGDWNLQI